MEVEAGKRPTKSRQHFHNTDDAYRPEQHCGDRENGQAGESGGEAPDNWIYEAVDIQRTNDDFGCIRKRLSDSDGEQMAAGRSVKNGTKTPWKGVKKIL